MRALALAVFLLALAACASQPKRVPIMRPPVKTTRSVPAAPAPARTPAPVITVSESRSYEQEKIRSKLALSKNSRDSLASSEVGYYMDVLQGRLKQVAGKSMGIARHGDRIVIDLSDRAGFEPGSAQIKPGIREILTPLSKVLVEYRKTLLSVRVRADDTGAHASNQQLAEQRALALAHYLSDLGVSDKRIVTGGVGSENRVRVELQVEPVVRVPGS